MYSIKIAMNRTTFMHKGNHTNWYGYIVLENKKGPSN